MVAECVGAGNRELPRRIEGAYLRKKKWKISLSGVMKLPATEESIRNLQEKNPDALNQS